MKTEIFISPGKKRNFFFFFLLVIASNLIAQTTTTFTVTSDGTPVEGMTVEVDGLIAQTDAAGEAVFDLPDGDYAYYVYTSGYPETVVIGTNMFTYLDKSGDGWDDAYDNVFITQGTISLPGTTQENVALTTTTFNTTENGSGRPASFFVTADYVNAKGLTQTKTIVELTTDAAGSVSVPLPTHRTDARGNILAFTDFMFYDEMNIVSGSFDPVSASPVEIVLPPMHDVTFEITAGGIPVEGITVEAIGTMTRTDASGQAVLNLPETTVDYMVYTPGHPETITVGESKFTYNDDGGWEGATDSYDNIFINNGQVVVTGAITESVELDVTTFNTSIGGSASPVAFEVFAYYLNPNGFEKTKSIINLKSDDLGSVTVPLPTHRNSSVGDILTFYDFDYSAAYGLVTGPFDPLTSPVLVELPEFYDVTFNVTAGGQAVQDISVGVHNVYDGVDWVEIPLIKKATDAGGQAMISLPAGEYLFSVFTDNYPETILIGGNSFTYKDEGGTGEEDSYNNIFLYSETLSVSGAGTKDVLLTTTEFQTTENGSAVSATFAVTADYTNPDGFDKTKVITELTTDQTGSVSLPLPTHRDSRIGDILQFMNYTYYAAYGVATGTFTLADSPVEIALPESNDVTFNVTAGGQPVQGITVEILGDKKRTDASGHAVFSLPAATFDYMVYTPGHPETITVGDQIFTYNDEGEWGNDDSYDNIFLPDGQVVVTGVMTEEVLLDTTTFNTSIGGIDAPVEFEVLAYYLNRLSEEKNKMIIELQSDDQGAVTVPLPTHRNDRHGSLLTFYDFTYLAAHGLVSGIFDPLSSPVLVQLPEFYDITFNVTAGGEAVEDISVGVHELKDGLDWVEIPLIEQVTDANGEALIKLPEGEFMFSVFTDGSPETITIGSERFTYKDEGGRGDNDSYDNIFLFSETITVYGAATKDVPLTVTEFQTTENGTAVSAKFAVTADYTNPNNDVKTKVLAELMTDQTGSVSLPLPTHRDSEVGDILQFTNYMYYAAYGTASGTFDPATSPVEIALPQTNDVTFAVNAGGVPVQGIAVDILGDKKRTDAAGEVVFSLPEGTFNYMVCTPGHPETIIVGENIFTYLDLGGSGDEDSYDNIFLPDGQVVVTGAMTENVALDVTTFNTSIGGAAAPVEFMVLADYVNPNNSIKAKSIIKLASNDQGTVTVPLPTHRNSRVGEVMGFYNYSYSAVHGLLSDYFDPQTSPVLIELPVFYDVTLTVTAGGTAVERATINVEGFRQVTNNAGEARFKLPEGEFNYRIQTLDDMEMLTIGDKKYKYLDIGGSGYPGRYDNIFKQGVLNVAGLTDETIVLSTTTFNTNVGGVAAPAKFKVSASYINSDGDRKSKDLVNLMTESDGTVTLPLPYFRDDQRGSVLTFYDYRYAAEFNTASGTFNPDESPVIIDIPALSELTFTITSGGEPVEGIDIGIMGSMRRTDSQGKATLNILDGTYDFGVFTHGRSESIKIAGQEFNYLDMGGDGTPDSYNNIFNLGSVTVDGSTSKNVDLVPTEFNTTIGGTAAPASFVVYASYINNDGNIKKKRIVIPTTDEAGSISLPLPSHRTSREGNILKFFDYKYTDLIGAGVEGLFEPQTSPVNIDFPALNEVKFVVTDGTDPIEGLTVRVEHMEVKTDAAGEAVMLLPEGETDYAVYSKGSPEVIKIGDREITFLDIGGRDNQFMYADPYDNIFALGSFSVSGSSTEDITLTPTVFETYSGGTSVSGSFNVLANYINNDGDEKVKNIISLTTDVNGSVGLPLPTHRTSREGPILEFYKYMYSDLSGSVKGMFDPLVSPVQIELGDASIITFSVTDEVSGNPVQSAFININGQPVTTTGVNGTAIIHLIDGTYTYSVSRYGYDDVEETVLTVNSADATIDVVMTPSADSRTVIFTVTDEATSDPLQDAVVRVNGHEITPTGVNGNTSVVLLDGEYTYDVTREGYVNVPETPFTVSGSDLPIAVAMTRVTYTVTFTVLDTVTEDPLEGAEITVDGQVLPLTNTAGITSIKLPDGSYTYSVNMEGYYGLSSVVLTVDGADVSVTVRLQEIPPTYTVTFTVTDTSSAAIEGAIVNVDGEPLPATDGNGQTSTVLENGDYSYTVTREGYDDIGVTAFTVNGEDLNIPVQMELATGIGSQITDQARLYPNPSSDYVIIEFENEFTGILEVMSVSGKVLIQKKLDAVSTQTIDVSPFESGIYIVRVGSQHMGLVVE
ncbi:MAG: T9SS type A sorting domain-containing protein [Bacteroidales bacterium]|nr:T9SS type A sorting domain-containing protein [Bacteroidales bacterium]